MKKLTLNAARFPSHVKWASDLSTALRSCFFIFFILIAGHLFAQSFPTSCTSKDLTLLTATLPAPAGDRCNCDGDRILVLGIRNGTNSFRTSFALWGTLIRKDSEGEIISSLPIFACVSGIKEKNKVPNGDNFLPASTIEIDGVPAETNNLGQPVIRVNCGESLDIMDMHLAWTTSNDNETCAVLKNNPSTINPKCGTQALIHIGIGVEAVTATTDATCSVGGKIKVTPSGGIAPYEVSLDGGNYIAVPANPGYYEFSGVSAGEHTIAIRDNTNRPVAERCSINVTPTVNSPAAVTVNAGTDFTKTCNGNQNGQQIGEASEAGFTYSWSPADGLSSSTSSNPTANPSSSKTYTVTKTNTATGCSATDAVEVTVNKPVVTAFAGDDFTKSCNGNSSGKQIGEVSAEGFTYSWSPADGLSSSTSSNPTANPSSTTIYTVTKTHTTSGCSATDAIEVTVDKPAVTAFAGDDFTKSCNGNSNGKQIGEASEAGFTYSWSPADGLSSSTSSNPTANPSSTTTYTVTKTHTSSGCSATDAIDVTVNKPTVTAFAGDDFTKSCIENPTGKQIGEASAAGFTYSWSPTDGLSSSSSSDPTANPSSTKTYTVTKIHTTSGCSATDEVTVTVSTGLPTFTVCLVQPDLCNQYGSLTINATNGSNFTYKLNNGSPQASNLFNNLSSGSVTSITVINGNGCSTTVSCAELDEDCTTAGRSVPSTNVNREVTTPETTVKAYPNPFNDRIKFVVSVPQPGYGSLEVMNMLGQKVKTIFQGPLNAGNQTFEMVLPQSRYSTLFYIFRMNGKQVSGKLIQRN